MSTDDDLVARIATQLQDRIRAEEDRLFLPNPRAVPSLTTSVLDDLAKSLPQVYLLVDDDAAQTPLLAMFPNQQFFCTEQGRDHPKVPQWMREADKLRRLVQAAEERRQAEEG